MHISSHPFPLIVNILHYQGGFVKTKKLTLIYYLVLTKRFVSFNIRTFNTHLLEGSAVRGAGSWLPQGHRESQPSFPRNN